MIRKLGLGVAAIALSGSAVFGDVYADDKADFDALLKDHWARANKEQIFFRTDPDAYRPNGKLAEFSSEARARRQAFNADMLTRLAKIDESKLKGQDRISYKLFKYERETEAESYRQPDHLFPITRLFGYHTYFANAPFNMAFGSAADYERYLISLADFPRYNRENIDLLKEAIERGFTHYCASMEGYENTISMHVVDDAVKSNLYHPFTVFPANLTDAEKQDLAAKGKALVENSIIPAYRELLEFFTEDYMPKCRTNIGITSVKGGDTYYQYLINYFTTTDMSPKEIHELGLAEAKRIRGEMDAIIRKVGFDGSFKEFLNFLRTDPRFFAKDGQELLEKTAFIAKKMDGQMPRFFGRLARNTYEIRGVTGRGAYYVSGSGDGRTPGTYFISVGDLKSQPLYNLEALSLHEGVPGHHHQTAIALELDVPEFRKTLYHSAFGEGWGLYSEALGKEAGFYTDPYSDFGRLTYEMWRANRLVVDTGMHALGWSREKAIDYMLASSALTEGEVTAEIDRYITWPAQALSYKIGELRIKAMRAKAERELGAKFDLRAFHDTVVGNGSLAIAVLEEIVDEWIEGQK
ncbi:DUF885 family protein [Kordiimonas sp. SCSIO 12610]|uniref:DUF885 domain-containing protein n=1 Tax=Kordiimonas sp. SCSIO 12610 TaxID=2829597 RepID=UPI00210E73B4|nr:DUF885 domain-containing protein [Kordiimonas sp. SCSIO 12610]UTW56116.1 DUF885 domain-containing protein [Kordiimonas sp. SCSIO 12610]